MQGRLPRLSDDDLLRIDLEYVAARGLRRGIRAFRLLDTLLVLLFLLLRLLFGPLLCLRSLLLRLRRILVRLLGFLRSALLCVLRLLARLLRLLFGAHQLLSFGPDIFLRFRSLIQTLLGVRLGLLRLFVCVLGLLLRLLRLFLRWRLV
jgi:hypothetical protein